MSAKVRDKALSREQEDIRNRVFKIIEERTIEFKGKLYNIVNRDKLVKELSKCYIERKVLARC